MKKVMNINGWIQFRFTLQYKINYDDQWTDLPNKNGKISDFTIK